MTEAAATASAPTVAPAAVATLSATSVSFGNQKVGTTSAAKTVTLTNTGGGTLTIGSLDCRRVDSGRLLPERDVRGGNCVDS